jgi:hypothetical protein
MKRTQTSSVNDRDQFVFLTQLCCHNFASALTLTSAFPAIGPVSELRFDETAFDSDGYFILNVSYQRRVLAV